MAYPHFIAIDASSYEEEAHPIAIAWSMTDGRIKTTLIQPDDGWEDWDYALEDIHGISQDTLYQRGETAWSVVRELENDLEQTYLMTEEADRTEMLLDKIYDACGRELSLEVGEYSEEISDQQALSEATDQLYHQQLTCDERVLVMLQVWAREHGVQMVTEDPEEEDEDKLEG